MNRWLLLGVIVAWAATITAGFAVSAYLSGPDPDDEAAVVLRQSGVRFGRQLRFQSWREVVPGEGGDGAISSVHFDRGPSLEELNIVCRLATCRFVSFRHATFGQVGNLNALAGMPCLDDLYITHSGFSDDDLAAIQPVLRRLWCASFDKTQISDKSVDLLASLPGLKAIYLRETRITPEGFARLRQARPDLDIESDGPAPP